MLGLFPNALRVLITTLLWPGDAAPPPLRFQLRHEHAITNDSRIVFSNAPSSFSPIVFSVPTINLVTHRPSSLDSFARARWRSMKFGESESLLWDDEVVTGPDVQKRETLLQLAMMTSNDYFEPTDKEWYTMHGWNRSVPFGRLPEDDGLRGHIFVSDDDSTVVLSIKGTSAPWIAGGGGPTVKKDKLNDNILFSCCCARVGPTWYPVCDCYSSGNKCDSQCVEESLQDESLFYPTGLNLYNDVSYIYPMPKSGLWVRHSLGGALASLLGVTFGAPVVTFEAVGEKMAASRLHLPTPPSTQHITHVYHTGDPIPQGACTGVTSTCAVGGYALESRCHLGKVIRYDTVSKMKWSVDVRSHPIKYVIENVLNEDWDAENGVEVPQAEAEVDCVDCYHWEYGKFKDA